MVDQEKIPIRSFLFSFSFLGLYWWDFLDWSLPLTPTILLQRIVLLLLSNHVAIELSPITKLWPTHLDQSIPSTLLWARIKLLQSEGTQRIRITTYVNPSHRYSKLNFEFDFIYFTILKFHSFEIRWLLFTQGNPWYISTLAAGEQLYSALNTWNRAGALNITTVSLPFFTALVPSATVGTYLAGSSQYSTITGAIRTYADGFLATVQKYIGTNGALSEQYDKWVELIILLWASANWFVLDLLVNHFLLEIWLGRTLPSWLHRTLELVRSLNHGDRTLSEPFVDLLVVRHQLPQVEMVLPSTLMLSQTLILERWVFLLFSLAELTPFLQNILLVGSIPQLGNWDTSKALPLSASKYTSSNNLWFVNVALPANTHFEYKVSLIFFLLSFSWLISILVHSKGVKRTNHLSIWIKRSFDYWSCWINFDDKW